MLNNQCKFSDEAPPTTQELLEDIEEVIGSDVIAATSTDPIVAETVANFHVAPVEAYIDSMPGVYSVNAEALPSISSFQESLANQLRGGSSQEK